MNGQPTHRMPWIVAAATTVAGAVALASGQTEPWAGLLVLLACHLPILLGAWCLAGRLTARRVDRGSSASELVLTGQTYFASLVVLGLVLGHIGLLTRPATLISAGLLGLAMMWTGRRFAFLPVGRLYRYQEKPSSLAKKTVAPASRRWGHRRDACATVWLRAKAALRRSRLAAATTSAPPDAAPKSVAHNPRFPTKVPFVILVLIVVAAAVAWKSLADPTYEYDVLTYHLMFPARWTQDAAISIVPTWFGDPAPAYAPSTTEVYYTWLMLPMGEDLVARGGQFPFWILLLAAAHALGRELGLRPRERSWACLALALLPAITAQAATAMVDVAFTAHLLSTAMFALRASRTRRTADGVGLILAIGLLLGAKFIAIAYLTALSPLLIWAFWRLLRLPTKPWSWRGLRLPADRYSRPVLILTTMAAAWIGGFWYARNWAVTGNPVYPLEVKLGSTVVFGGAYGRPQMENSIFNVRRRTQPDALGQTLWEAVHSPHMPWPSRDEQGFTAAFRYWYLGPVGLIAVLFTVAAISVARRAPSRTPRLLFYICVVAMFLVFWYVLPFQQPRFAWGPIAAALIGATAVARLHRRAPLVLLLLGIAAWAIFFTEDLREGFAIPAPAWITAFLLAGAWMLVHRVRSSTTAWLLGAVALLFACILGVASTSNGSRTRALADPRFFPAAWPWIDQNLHNVTIAYAGNNVPYFLCGRRLENRVLYVPARQPSDGKYHYFASLPETLALGAPNTSEPAFDRFIMDPATWLDNLRALGVDYVLVNPLFPNLLPNYRHDPQGFPIEREWLDSLCKAPPGTEPAAHCRVFEQDGVRLYKLDLDAIDAFPPRLRRVIRDETDAIDRLHQDGPRAGQPIRDYPHARRIIEQAGLRLLEP
ncbi:MAG: hypothetical protein JXQ75_19205 [Phycisphaerae bacterium]|nr:hypothetical protein [Phycisphaerae bacterium]